MNRSTFSIPALAIALLTFGGCSDEGAAGAAEPANTAVESSTGGGSTSQQATDDQRHRLYQAAASTGDTEIIQDMYQRIGLLDGAVADQAKVQAFATAHGEWVQGNLDFIQKVSTPEQARAWYDQNK